MHKHVAAGLLVLAAASPAYADICAWNTQAVAQNAARMIKPGDTIQGFCPGCGDRVATATTVQSVTSGPVAGSPEYYEVKVNGRGVDLAYVYVRAAGAAQWSNLGAAVSCSTDNDSPRVLGPELLPH